MHKIKLKKKVTTVLCEVQAITSCCSCCLVNTVYMKAAHGCISNKQIGVVFLSGGWDNSRVKIGSFGVVTPPSTSSNTLKRRGSLRLTTNSRC